MNFLLFASARYQRAISAAGLLALILLAALVARPGLRLPWALIDDGWAQMSAQTMDSGIRAGRLLSLGPIPAGLIVLGPDGRVRPATLLYRWAQYRLFGDLPPGYHAVRGLEFALTTALVAGLAREAARSRWAGLVAGLLWVCNAPSSEHWMRLFTQEPQLILAGGASLWLILRAMRPARPGRGNAMVALSAVLLGLAYLVKETAVFMLPTSAGLWLFSRSRLGDGAAGQRRLTTRYFALNAALAAGLLALVRLVRAAPGGYTDYFDLGNLSQMISNARSYALYALAPFAPALPLAILAGIGGGLARLRRPPGSAQARLWAAAFVTWPVAWLLVFLPWGSQQAYYMLGVTFAVCLWLGWATTAGVRGLPPGYRPLAAGAAAVCLAGYVALNAPWQHRFIAGFEDRGQTDARLVEYLAEAASPNGRVWFNLNPLRTEWGQETGLHLARFYQRGDVQIHFLGETPGPQPGDFVVGGLRDARFPAGTLLAQFDLTPGRQVTLGDGPLAWWVVQVAANGEGG